MKTKQIFSHALLLVAGLLIGTFFINKNYFLFHEGVTIPLEQAKIYFKNYRQVMKYGVKDTTSGYFDISSNTFSEMTKYMIDKKKARVYFGESSNLNPDRTFFMMIEVDERGIEITDNILSISVLNQNSDCPKYCDIKTTALGK